MLLFLLVAFIAVPILEIAALIKVGALIGLWPTLALTVVTAIAGAGLVRYQGFRTLMALKHNIDSGQLPVEPAVHAGFLLVAGLCLLTPGFVTDAVGFVLLVPPVRLAIARWLWRYMKRHGDVTIVAGQSHRYGPSRDGPGPVIELQAEDVSDDQSREPEDPRSPASPWRKGDGPTG